MKPVALSREEAVGLIRRLRDFARDDLEHEISELQAGMLLDLIRDEMAPAFYNRGLYDAQAVVSARAEEIGEAILALERPVGR